jgi:hypothetical protein
LHFSENLVPGVYALAVSGQVEDKINDNDEPMLDEDGDHVDEDDQ